MKEFLSDEGISLWRGDLSPLGCEAALNQTTRWIRQIKVTVGLLRSPAGINPLATGMYFVSLLIRKFSMFKKIVSFSALVVAALSPSLVLAADDALTSIHITANIPNKQFHVMPRDPEFGKNEFMYYNPVTKRLSPVRQIFDVKNTDGSVHAYIDGSSWLNNGQNYIVTVVAFNNVYLSQVPQEVVDDATSTPGTTAELHIYAPFATTPKQSGLYTGQFTVVFDAVPRVSL